MIEIGITLLSPTEGDSMVWSHRIAKTIKVEVGWMCSIR